MEKGNFGVIPFPTRYEQNGLAKFRLYCKNYEA